MVSVLMWTCSVADCSWQNWLIYAFFFLDINIKVNTVSSETIMWDKTMMA